VPAIAFMEALTLTVKKQSAPYAIICVFGPPNSESTTHSDNTKNDERLLIIKNALALTTDSSYELLSDDQSHIAIVINPSSISRTNQLTRVIRYHFMRAYPAILLSIAAAQVDDNKKNIDVLLAELYKELNRNIKDATSRIRVEHYKKSGPYNR